jgi:uncharacterized protein
MESSITGLAGAALVVGLLSGLHCSAMCGGLIALFGSGRPRYTLLLHTGRLTGYGGAGALAGALGTAVFQAAAFPGMHLAFIVFANLLLIAAGINLTGIARLTQVLERFGMTIWRRLQPITRRILPVDSVASALLAGILWGWLPCGMVYAVLPSALASGHALSGALVMVAFGLGTLPNLVALGFLWRNIKTSVALSRARLGAGLAVVALGVFGIASLLVGSHQM